MYIKINDNDFIDFDLDVFEENEYEKFNIHFEMLCKTLGIKDFYTNKIQISNFKSEEEAVRFINYFMLNTMKSIRSFENKSLSIFYKPYMLQNDFEIICSNEVFNKILEMVL